MRCDLKPVVLEFARLLPTTSSISWLMRKPVTPVKSEFDMDQAPLGSRSNVVAGSGSRLDAADLSQVHFRIADDQLHFALVHGHRADDAACRVPGRVLGVGDGLADQAGALG